MEVDVEGDEVHEVGDVEIFGGWEVGVADERLRAPSLHLVAQDTQELAHPLRAVPAYDVGRDLVADQEAEQGRMATAGVGGGAHRAADLRAHILAVEEADVLGPGHRDQHAEAMPG